MGGSRDIPTEITWFQYRFLSRRVGTSSLRPYAGLEMEGSPYGVCSSPQVHAAESGQDALLYTKIMVFSYKTNGTGFSRRLIGSASQCPSSSPCHLAVGVSSALGSLQDAPSGASIPKIVARRCALLVRLITKYLPM